MAKSADAAKNKAMEKEAKNKARQKRADALRKATIESKTLKNPRISPGISGKGGAMVGGLYRPTGGSGLPYNK